MFKKLAILTIHVVLALMASVPAVSTRGQALTTSSVWVANDIHINFNARRIYDEENPIAATGHVF